MASTYPGAIKVFVNFEDYVNINYAENLNEMHDEIVSMETVLGTQPQLLHDPSHTSNTVGDVLDTLDTGKSPVGHTHTSLPSSTLGGPASGFNISANLNNLQAQNNDSPAPMTLQFNGGDLVIGSANIQVTVNGSINTQNGSLATDTFTAQTGNIEGDLNVQGLHSAQDIVANGNITANDVIATNVLEGFRLLVATNGRLDLNNGETIHGGPPGTVNQTWLDGSTLDSIKVINGQLVVIMTHPSATGVVWNEAIAIYERPPTFSDGYISFWNYWNGGTAFQVFTDAQQLSFGVQSRTAAGDPGPFTGSSFISTSHLGSKEDIQGIPQGLKELKKLRPIQFRRPKPDFFAPRKPDKGRGWKAIHGPEKEALRSGHEAGKSKGDIRRESTPYHGLIAEDVATVIPHVVHHNSDGTPYGIDYGALVPLLIKSVQELAAKVEGLEGYIKEHML